MEPRGPGLTEEDWPRSVEVRDDPELGRELLDRYRRVGAGRPVSVTDLVALRRAFWRRRGPPPPVPPERAATMSLGRSWHRVVGRLLGEEGALEVRLRRDGVSCRIDLMADVPVEIKTSTIPVPNDVLGERPEHVEQLGMYCALTRRSTGRLVHILLADGRATEVRASDVEFGSVDRIAVEMRRRESALREGLDRGSPTDLPRCRWFGRGCEFHAAGVCDCRGDEPVGPSEILGEARTAADRPDVSARWHELLRSASGGEGQSWMPRFRDIIYPRRAFFDRTRVRAPATSASPTEATRSRELYDRLVATVESGPVGEVRQLVPAADVADEDVVGFRGAPFLLRTSRAGGRILSADAVARYPQYALELGLRCAATGTSHGRVVLGYERAEDDSDRLHVLEYRFRPLSTFSVLAAERTRQLAEAVARGNPGELVACPGWMFTDCPYREDCGCGVAAGRSQR